MVKPKNPTTKGTNPWGELARIKHRAEDLVRLSQKPFPSDPVEATGRCMDMGAIVANIEVALNNLDHYWYEKATQKDT